MCYSSGRSSKAWSQRLWNLLWSGTVLLSYQLVQPPTASGTTGQPPNIIFILADDLGYGELGCYGQKKIKTPHIDRLAREGLLFTQHYCGSPVCAPSRCVLLSGKHSGRATIRSNQKAQLNPEFMEKYGLAFHGQLPIPDEEVTVAEVLKQRGYATAAIGKWGLGQIGTTGDPNRQGFDLFFGYNGQAHAHSYYPGHLWRNHEKVLLDNHPPIPGHASLAPGADPRDPASYMPFQGQDYAPNHTLEEALQFVRDHRDGPFFLYYPSTIPHLALQVPDAELEPYLDKWPETPFDRKGGYGYTPHLRPRAAYAAMISRLDMHVGRILELLTELALEKNTLVVFSSDNGPTHLRDEVDYTFFASAGPLRGLKGSVYEGGIRVPMITRWPGKISPGGTSDLLCAFWDWLPTLAEVAGAVPPDDVDGISLVPTLLGHPESQSQHDHLYWEFTGYGGQQAVRRGRWKGVRQNILGKKNPDPLKIELFDLQLDLAESRDISSAHPDIVARMRNIMSADHASNRNFPMPLIEPPLIEP